MNTSIIHVPFFISTTFVCLLLAAPTSGQSLPADGDWTSNDPARCEFGGDTLNLAIRIREGLLYGVESACRFTNPTAVRGMAATLYDMECTGEGETWGYRLLLMPNGDGTLTMIQDGWTNIMEPCAAETPRSHATVAPSK